jgi:hypothetical protein
VEGHQHRVELEDLEEDLEAYQRAQLGEPVAAYYLLGLYQRRVLLLPL